MNRPLTLGSLFDGSGGFPLGGLLCGIEPLWASEVEPFPIRVTTKRFPNMKHYGDISKINGASVPPVDVLTGGFCCQDLSVAGKRRGIHGERSGLFFQITRIIREMLAATENEYPKFCVLENVPGMYSSADGADYLEVLNELARIKDEAVSIPMPPKGKWSTTGEIVGDGFSIGWRTFDAQFWGVAQRRRRCYVVLDLTGGRAGEILFDETRLRGNPPQSRLPRQGAAGSPAAGVGGAVRVLNDQGGRRMDVSENVAGTLRAAEHSHAPVVFHSAGFCTEHSAASHSVGYEEEKSPTLRAGTVPGALVYDARGNGSGSVVNTLTGDHNGHISDYTTLAVLPTAYGISSYNSNGMLSDNPHAGIYEAETARTLDGNGGNPSCNQGGIAVVTLQGSMIGRGDKNGPMGSGVNDNVCFTLNTIDKHAVAYDCRNHAVSDMSGTLQVKGSGGQSLNFINPVAQAPQYIVRRLTPSECAMLQGFPPDWCAGLETPAPAAADIAFWTEVWETHRRIADTSSKPKSRKQIVKWLRDPHSDSAEYKMWGNGVSLPVVVFVLEGIVLYA